MAAPLYMFSIFFVLGPMVYGFLLSFFERAGGMQVDYTFTLENYKRIWDYRDTFLLSLKVGITTTFITALIGYPFGYFMARLKRRSRQLVLMLLIIPFLTSSLLRINGWTAVLKANGILERLLIKLGIIDGTLKLMYNYETVIFGMVYMLLPFMILSVYSAKEKMDWSLLDAAFDLGAGPVKAFFTITARLTINGLYTGIVLTFIPAMGLFFVAERMGGNKIYLIGNLIKDQITNARNIPFGAALAVVLAAITTVFLLLPALVKACKSSFRRKRRCNPSLKLRNGGTNEDI